MTLTAEYKQAFNRCYPQKRVSIKIRGGRNGETQFTVIIDDDAGAKTLTEDDMRFAIRMFNRGWKL